MTVRKRPTQERFKTFTLMPQGTKHSATELSQMFGVPHASISRLKKKGKTTWTTAEMREWAERIKCGSDIRSMQFSARWERNDKKPLNINDIEYNPSAAERAMLRF